MTKGLVVAVVVLVALWGSSCGTCAIYCARLQKISFADSAGNPLNPLQVTDGQVHRCDSGGFVTCDGNSLTYDARSSAPRTIQAQAMSGEVFSGEIIPVLQPGTPRPLNSCGCGGDTLKPLTIKLSPP